MQYSQSKVEFSRRQYAAAENNGRRGHPENASHAMQSCHTFADIFGTLALRCDLVDFQCLLFTTWDSCGRGGTWHEMRRDGDTCSCVDTGEPCHMPPAFFAEASDREAKDERIAAKETTPYAKKVEALQCPTPMGEFLGEEQVDLSGGDNDDVCPLIRGEAGTTEEESDDDDDDDDDDDGDPDEEGVAGEDDD